MPSLLLVVFCLNLAIQLVNFVGGDSFSNFLWYIYTLVPSSPVAALQARHRKLRVDLHELQTSLKTVSAQDSFAKWARIRRSKDQIESEYNTCKTELDAKKSAFTSRLSTVRWLSTTGLKQILQLWFAREALLWLPQGLLPGPIEYMISFPRAPRGAVGIQAWGMACSTIFTLLFDLASAIKADNSPGQPGQKGSPVGAGKSPLGQESKQSQPAWKHKENAAVEVMPTESLD